MSEKQERQNRKSKPRTPGSGNKNEDNKTGTRRNKGDQANPPPIIKTKSEKSLTKSEKGSKKRKKSRNHDVHGKKKEEKKKHSRSSRKSLYERIMLNFGFYVGHVQLRDPRAIEAAQALDLRQWHLRRLRAKFDQIDIDGSGNIDFDEFFEAIGEIRSPFTDKLFALIDVDKSGTIEFDEFVRVLATYCMFSKDEILRFCFECFDVDRSGTIDEKEFVELCKCVNNASPSFPNNFKNALEQFDVNEDGLIDYSEFVELDRRYPLVLFPAFRLQDMMQRKTLGERVWLQVIQNYQEVKRIEEYKAQHGGRAPPDPPLKAILKFVLPCFFHERVHISVGAEMENRHQLE